MVKFNMELWEERIKGYLNILIVSGVILKFTFELEEDGKLFFLDIFL